MIGTMFQFDWEVSLIMFMQQLLIESPFLKTLMVIITYLGSEYFMILITLIYYFGRDKEEGVFMAISVLLTQLTGSMFKNRYQRLRPYFVNDGIECLHQVESGDLYDPLVQGFSFPSLHSAGITSLAISPSFYDNDARHFKIWLPIVILVMISRFSLGVHYPTDVLFGFLLAVIVCFLVDFMDRKIEKKKMFLLIALFSMTGIFFCTSKDYYSVLGLILGFMGGNLLENKYVGFKESRDVKTVILQFLTAAVFFGATVLFLRLFKPVFAGNFYAKMLYESFYYMMGTISAIFLCPLVFRNSLFK